MKDTVRIKHFPNGLIIQMSEQADYQDILKEIAQKFKEGKTFFGKAAVAISFQGRELSDEEEERILVTIEQNCNLQIVCVVEKDEVQEKLFGKALQHFERQKLAEAEIGKEIQVFQGSLSDGEELDTPNNVIILGDVGSDCTITSEKSIIILGALYGEAHAGKGDTPDGCFIAAMEMAPRELYIGDFKYIPEKKNRWIKKQKEISLIARLQDKTIIMEKLTKEHLRNF